MRYVLIWLYALSEVQADGLQLRVLQRQAGAVPRDDPSRLKMFNDLSAALAAGLGYGAMATVMTYGALLGAAASQEAAFYLDACPAIPAYVLAGASGGPPRRRGGRVVGGAGGGALRRACHEARAPSPLGRNALRVPAHLPTRPAAVTALLLNVLHIALSVVAMDAWRRGGVTLRAAPAAAHLVFSLLTLLNTTSGACAATLPLLAVVVGVAVAGAVRVVRAPDYAATRQMRAWERLVALHDAGGGARGRAD